jgi:hypothetical protein
MEYLCFRSGPCRSSTPSPERNGNRRTARHSAPGCRAPPRTSARSSAGSARDGGVPTVVAIAVLLARKAARYSAMTPKRHSNGYCYGRLFSAASPSLTDLAQPASFYRPAPRRSSPRRSPVRSRQCPPPHGPRRRVAPARGNGSQRHILEKGIPRDFEIEALPTRRRGTHNIRIEANPWCVDSTRLRCLRATFATRLSLICRGRSFRRTRRANMKSPTRSY